MDVSVLQASWSTKRTAGGYRYVKVRITGVGVDQRTLVKHLRKIKDNWPRDYIVP